MSVAKTIEISAESPVSFEAAVQEGVTKASETIKNIRSVWVKDQSATVENGKITGYRVNLKLTFELS